jgi:3''5''-cyclic nucleotide phosphodiesterase.
MHATHYLMKRTYTFDPLVHLGLIVAALCHDVAHTGRTNAYEIAKLTKLAIRYHDKSVLEQHHAATTFKILDDKKYNIFANIKGEEFRKLRKNMISNILATDMKEHVELMKNFKDLKNRMGEAANVEEFGNLSLLLK